MPASGDVSTGASRCLRNLRAEGRNSAVRLCMQIAFPRFAPPGFSSLPLGSGRSGWAHTPWLEMSQDWPQIH